MRILNEINFTSSDIDLMKRCAKRELTLRLCVYPKRIFAGKMKKEQADFEIEGMTKIVNLLEQLQSNATEEQQTLFN